MVTLKTRGGFKKATARLEKLNSRQQFRCLDAYGAKGVELLSAATPVDTGETAHSWYYKIKRDDKTKKITIEWHNSKLDDESNVPVVILIQYGHVTGAGTYVHGIDIVNPALQDVFRQMSNEVWREVTHK